MVPEDVPPRDKHGHHTNKEDPHCKKLHVSSQSTNRTHAALCCHVFCPQTDHCRRFAIRPFGVTTLWNFILYTLVSIIHDTLIILWTSNTSNSAIHKTKTVIKWRALLVNSICVSMQLIWLQEGISVPVL